MHKIQRTRNVRDNLTQPGHGQDRVRGNSNQYEKQKNETLHTHTHTHTHTTAQKNIPVVASKCCVEIGWRNVPPSSRDRVDTP